MDLFAFFLQSFPALRLLLHLFVCFLLLLLLLSLFSCSQRLCARPCVVLFRFDARRLDSKNLQKLLKWSETDLSLLSG